MADRNSDDDVGTELDVEVDAGPDDDEDEDVDEDASGDSHTCADASGVGAPSRVDCSDGTPSVVDNLSVTVDDDGGGSGGVVVGVGVEHGLGKFHALSRMSNGNFSSGFTGFVDDLSPDARLRN